MEKVREQEGGRPEEQTARQLLRLCHELWENTVPCTYTTDELHVSAAYVLLGVQACFERGGMTRRIGSLEVALQHIGDVRRYLKRLRKRQHQPLALVLAAQEIAERVQELVQRRLAELLR